MRSMLTGSLLFAVGILHLTPLTGVLGGNWLRSLYGVEVTDTSMSLLLRHRAILFAIVGGILLVSAFTPAYRAMVIIVGMTSVASFLVLSWLAPPPPGPLWTVVYADLAAIVALTVAALLHATLPTPN